mmetsp:Transcript_29628/g.26204  ORF Transcript_29628/g.26204 Transcript_29628/m.26204 type:complete len:327 (-) Transcript_29628:1-981(-)
MIRCTPYIEWLGDNVMDSKSDGKSPDVPKLGIAHGLHTDSNTSVWSSMDLNVVNYVLNTIPDETANGKEGQGVNNIKDTELEHKETLETIIVYTPDIDDETDTTYKQYKTSQNYVSAIKDIQIIHPHPQINVSKEIKGQYEFEDNELSEVEQITRIQTDTLMIPEFQMTSTSRRSQQRHGTPITRHERLLDANTYERESVSMSSVITRIPTIPDLKSNTTTMRPMKPLKFANTLTVTSCNRESPYPYPDQSPVGVAQLNDINGISNSCRNYKFMKKQIQEKEIDLYGDNRVISEGNGDVIIDHLDSMVASFEDDDNVKSDDEQHCD